MLPVTVPTGPRLGRLVFGALLVAGLLGIPSGAYAAPGPPAPQQQAPQSPPAMWAVTLNQVTLYSGPSDQAVAFGNLPAQVTLQVLGYEGDWAHVNNPRTRTEGYVSSDELGPGDAPSRYITLPPPTPRDEFDVRGIVTDSASLAVYPTPADEAVEAQLNPNTWLTLTGLAAGEAGGTGYRTDTANFVAADAGLFPDPTEAFTAGCLKWN